MPSFEKEVNQHIVGRETRSQADARFDLSMYDTGRLA